MNPFTEDRKAGIGNWGELDLIAHIRQWLGPQAVLSPFGLQDDTAVLDLSGASSDQKFLITVDSLVYRKHFDDKAPAEKVGAKLLKRNLSDVAAMGGVPAYAVIALCGGSNVSRLWLAAFFKGLRDCAEAFGVVLAGGDVTELPEGQFSASLTLTGWAKHPVPRGGGEIGDGLFVTGFLGGSRYGGHLDFTPRLNEGRWLASRPEVKAMIDLSDGFAADVAHLLPTGAVASVDIPSLPIDINVSGSDEARARQALSDGEDYELLVVLDRETDAPAFSAAWKTQFAVPLTRVATVKKRPAVAPADAVLMDAVTCSVWKVSGYAHFSDD